MWLRGAAVAGLAAIVATTPAPAQSAGSVELGGFGRYTVFGESRGLEDGIGFGGRLGIFLSRHIALEGTISYAALESSPQVDYSYMPVHGRLLINLPLAERVDFLLGGGGVLNRYHSEDTDYGIGGLVGTRIYLSRLLALRIEGTLDHMPSSWNSNTVEIPGPLNPNPAATVTFADRTNYGIQAGLSLVFGRAAPVVAAAPPPPPPPPPAAQAPPPPPPSGMTPEQARAILLERVHFDFDRYNIRPDAQAVLERKLPILRANPNLRLQIEGHADERGSSEYNDALGLRRANAVRDWLIAQGLDGSRFDVVSYGESRPLVAESNEEAWAQNRRAEFVITAGGDNIVVPNN